MSASCRQFPRILLADDQGWHQTLSAWCGTAAGLLVSSRTPLPAFLSFDHVEYDPRVHAEALDAREAWPPLLRPGVLAGHDGYGAWEQAALSAHLARVDGTVPAGDALRALIAQTTHVRAWRPEDGALPAFVVATMTGGVSSLRSTSDAETYRPYDLEHLLGVLLACIPEEWRPARWPTGLPDAASDDGPPLARHVVNVALARYLGTRLAGSWVAYQGQGLLSVVASLVACHALAVLALGRDEGPLNIGRMTTALRATDWLVLHLLDRQAWADWCSQAEQPNGVPQLLRLLDAADEELDRLTGK